MLNQTDHARLWLRKGDSDLANAEQTLSGDGPYDTACFHAQQAAEKYLKAVLAYKECSIPRIHDLKLVHEECLKVAAMLQLPDVDVDELTPYAVTLRYDVSFWPDADTARRAVEIAKKVREAALQVLPRAAWP